MEEYQHGIKDWCRNSSRGLAVIPYMGSLHLFSDAAADVACSNCLFFTAGGGIFFRLKTKIASFLLYPSQFVPRTLFRPRSCIPLIPTPLEFARKAEEGPDTRLLFSCVEREKMSCYHVAILHVKSQPCPLSACAGTECQFSIDLSGLSVLGMVCAHRRSQREWRNL